MAGRSDVARKTAFSVGSALAVLFAGLLVLFVFAKATAEMHFGTASFWAYVGLGAALFTVVVAIATALQVIARQWGRAVARWMLVLPVAVLVAVGAGLTQQPLPVPVEFTEAPLPTTPQDVVILVDPSDPYVTALAERARSSPSEIAPSEVHSWGTDVAFGLAVLNGRAGGTAWSLVSRPTTDRAETLRALASVRPTSSAPERATLDRALFELADRNTPRIPWRKGSAHTIALVVNALPPQEPSGDALARLAQPAAIRRPSVSVWYRQKAQSAVYGKWLAWTRNAGGNLGSDTGRSMFDDVAQLSLNRYYFQDFLLAEQYRPHLKFDGHERFRPLDVTKFIAKEKPRLCRPRAFRPDDCEKVDSAPRLHGKDGYLRLGGEQRGGRDLPADDRNSPQRMYYRVSRSGVMVNIEYWWFFRYNVSPVFGDYMCLAGLSLAEGSCFDHQGDWEGITVSLVNKDGAGTSGGFVSYTGHGWPGYRYGWETLRGMGSIAKDTHPVVYVAFGSHASYPQRCRRHCTQLDFRHPIAGFHVPLPDGQHDGGADWPLNKGIGLFCGCLEELPAAFDGRPVSWNAFRGQWGAPACTFVLKSCTRSLGPPSPAHQPRFSDPLMSVWAAAEEPNGLVGQSLAPMSS
jgi:hypothetical protein